MRAYILINNFSGTIYSVFESLKDAKYARESAIKLCPEEELFIDIEAFGVIPKGKKVVFELLNVKK